MEFRTQLNRLRLAPKKVRLVADVIRGMAVPRAETELRFLKKKAAQPLIKLLRSATANAKNNYLYRGVSSTEENLYIKKITVDEGPVLKRWKPRAFGRAAPILKRSSRIVLVLAERKASKPKKVVKSEKKDEVATVQEIKHEVPEKKPFQYEHIKREEVKPLSRLAKIKNRFTRKYGEK